MRTLVVGCLAAWVVACGRSVPAPEADLAGVTSSGDAAETKRELAQDGGSPRAAGDTGAGARAPGGETLGGETLGGAPSVADAAPGDAQIESLAPEVAQEIPPDAKESVVAVLVPALVGDGNVALACWVVPAKDSPWAAVAVPRWETGRECVDRISVGMRAAGPGGVGAVTRIDGDTISASVTGAFLLVARDDDPRLGTTLAPSKGGPFAPIDGKHATREAAFPADGEGSARPLSRKADDAESAAVTRMVKRINGTDYATATISLDGAIDVDMNGDDVVDRVFLASSMDETGEGHAAGGGLFFADGRNPGRLVELAVDGQMASVDVLAVMDLDGDRRREVLMKMDCPTGTLFALGQLGKTGVIELGSRGDEGNYCASFRATVPIALPVRNARGVGVEAGLSALASLGGVRVGQPFGEVAQRFGLELDRGVERVELLGGGLVFLLSRGELRGYEVSIDGARAVAERLGSANGLEVLLDMDPKELSAALRPWLGAQRLAGGAGPTYDGAIDGQALHVHFVCPSEAEPCSRVRVVAYTPRAALPTRLSIAGISRLSTSKDLSKVFGVAEVVGEEERFAGGKVSAKYAAGGRLSALRIERDGVAAMKKPGLFSNLGQPKEVWVQRLGPPDLEGGEVPGQVLWVVPSPLAPVYRWALTCSPGGTCDVLTLTFPSE